MNSTERQMLDILKRGRDEFGYIAVKAEFEAEGTRTDELLRLMELARKAGLGVGLKIGGCEAVRDLIESRQFGVEYVIAPMVETPYALTKYIQAKNKIYSSEERQDTRFLFNIETRTAFESLDELVRLSTEPGGTDGIVFGRVDFSCSMGKTSNDINTSEVTSYVTAAARACKDAGLDYVVGGGVSRDALPLLCEIANTYLTRFETRKIIFAGASLPPAESDDFDSTPVGRGLLAAVHFEILWLQNKREYYNAIGAEDEKRIGMLEERWAVLSANASL